MYYSNEDSLKHMIQLLDKTAELKAQLADVASEMESLRTSSVGSLVSFPKSSWRNAKGENPYRYTMAELDDLLELKSTVETLLAQTIAAEQTEPAFEVGDVLETKFPIHTSMKDKQHQLDPAGGERYAVGNRFLVLDKLDSMNYVLLSMGKSDKYIYYDTSIMYATRSQIEVMMEVTNEIKPDQDWFKFEFTLNGPDPVKYAQYLDKVKLFVNPCQNRIKSEFEYDFMSTHETDMLSITADEVFGIMGTGYISGHLHDKYSSIICQFEDLPTERKQRNKKSKDRMKIGFHLKPGTKDTFNYDPLISYFIPFHFPKDVFVGGTKQRVVSLLDIVPLVKKHKPEEAALA